jgi:hypothetical protein
VRACPAGDDRRRRCLISDGGSVQLGPYSAPLGFIAASHLTPARPSRGSCEAPSPGVELPCLQQRQIMSIDGCDLGRLDTSQ